MKELKEKIKELRNKPYSEYERLSHNKAIDDILRLIEEEENKPFDPLELGFKIDWQDDCEICYTILEKIIWFDLRKNTYTISYNNYPVHIQTSGLKIPNHRFGVELLKNLRVIE